MRQALIREAAGLFVDRGFERTTLREVARCAGGSVGQLRAYFPTKAALFEAVCSPVPEEVEAALRVARSLPALSRAARSGREDERWVELVVAYVVAHRTKLQLLAFRAAGSPREGWRDGVLRAYVALEQARLDQFVAVHPEEVSRVPSPAFVRCVCSMYFRLAEDFVRGALDEAEFRTTVAELDDFRHAGASTFFREIPP